MMRKFVVYVETEDGYEYTEDDLECAFKKGFLECEESWVGLSVEEIEVNE